MLLIDDRPPPPPVPERPVWDPDWRTVGWVAAAVAAFTGAAFVTGFASFVLVCVALGCGAHALTRAVPPIGGMRDYRQ